MSNPIKIIIPFYNASAFIEKSLISAITQKYDNFHVVLINDASTDDSHEKISELLKEYTDKITYLCNSERRSAMFNHQAAVFNYCNPGDIVVQLDGDDWLVNNKVLCFIDDFYETNNCLMMYGQAKYLSGRQGNAKPYPTEEDFNNKRSLPFYVSHIRTFKADAFLEIKKQDPELNCFKDEFGNWLSMSCDVAMMYPIMEICGYDKVKYNEQILYIYNDSNPLSDFRIDLVLQEKIHNYVLRKPPFNQVEL